MCKAKRTPVTNKLISDNQKDESYFVLCKNRTEKRVKEITDMMDNAKKNGQRSVSFGDGLFGIIR